MPKATLIVSCVCILSVVGCGQSTEKKPEKTGIFKKTTQEVGVFDPNAKEQVSDQKIQYNDPLTGPMTVYDKGMQRVSIAAVDYCLRIFEANEGRYPKDHAEFMEKIIKANQIELPVLPYKQEYRYNEKDHTLVVVKPAAEEKAE